MSNENWSILDNYAAFTLQALIQKLPLIDRDGDFSEAKSQEEINSIKNHIARSAYDYAIYMLKNRQEFTKEANLLTP